MRRTQMLVQTNPPSSANTCKSGVMEDRYGVHGNWAVPNKFQPHPNGSERTDQTKENLAKANEIVNATQAIKPSGMIA